MKQDTQMVTQRVNPKVKKKKMLLIGAAGSTAGILINELAEFYDLTGVDIRGLPAGVSFPGNFHQLDYTKRPMAEIFRQSSFDVLLHLGRIPSDATTNAEARFNLNVIGTHNLLGLAKKAGVKKIILMSSHLVYGALASNRLYMTEESTLRASQHYGELVDAVEFDHEATTFMWQNPELNVTILRPVPIIGSRIQNFATRFFDRHTVPKITGFDPLLQFLDEEDFKAAIRLVLEKSKTGVFNIAGEGVVALSKAIRMANRIPFSLPIHIPKIISQLPLVPKVIRDFHFPRHLQNYLKFPVVVSDDLFRESFGYFPAVKLTETLKKIRKPGS